MLRGLPGIQKRFCKSLLILSSQPNELRLLQRLDGLLPTRCQDEVRQSLPAQLSGLLEEGLHIFSQAGLKPGSPELPDFPRGCWLASTLPPFRNTGSVGPPSRISLPWPCRRLFGLRLCLGSHGTLTEKRHEKCTAIVRTSQYLGTRWTGRSPQGFSSQSLASSWWRSTSLRRAQRLASRACSQEGGKIPGLVGFHGGAITGAQQEGGQTPVCDREPRSKSGPFGPRRFLQAIGHSSCGERHLAQRGHDQRSVRQYGLRLQLHDRPAERPDRVSGSTKIAAVGWLYDRGGRDTLQAVAAGRMPRGGEVVTIKRYDTVGRPTLIETKNVGTGIPTLLATHSDIPQGSEGEWPGVILYTPSAVAEAQQDPFHLAHELGRQAATIWWGGVCPLFRPSTIEIEAAICGAVGLLAAQSYASHERVTTVVELFKRMATRPNWLTMIDRLRKVQDERLAGAVSWELFNTEQSNKGAIAEITRTCWGRRVSRSTLGKLVPAAGR